mgnify:FL=1
MLSDGGLRRSSSSQRGTSPGRARKGDSNVDVWTPSQRMESQSARQEVDVFTEWAEMRHQQEMEELRQREGLSPLTNLYHPPTPEEGVYSPMVSSAEPTGTVRYIFQRDRRSGDGREHRSPEARTGSSQAEVTAQY